jgi:hypothetical protein
VVEAFARKPTAFRSLPAEDRWGVLELIDGYRHTALLYVAAKLRFPDLLADKPLTPAALAEAAGANEAALRRLLSGLLCARLIEEANGLVSLTHAGKLLCTGVPESLWLPAIIAGEQFARSWLGLLHSAKTERPRFFRHYSQNILARVRFSPISRTSSRWPVRGWRRPASRIGELVGGDFFKDVPAAGDAYIMKEVLHDWDDERCTALLQVRCGYHGLEFNCQGACVSIPGHHGKIPERTRVRAFVIAERETGRRRSSRRTKSCSSSNSCG